MSRPKAGSSTGSKTGGVAGGDGVLFIVATPIGNLGDMTQRAIETLKTVDLILAEDTRKTRVLLDHFGIKTRMVSAHEHNESRTIPLMTETLGRKAGVAVVTDAGTPLISDPGSRLVQAARAAGYRVTPVPGASALTAALSACGLDTTRFTFFGFIPRTGRERREAIAHIAELEHTAVIYEAPTRVSDTLLAIADAGSGGGERRCVVARELTKLFEEFREGTVEELAAYYGESPPRGEVVILLSAAKPKPFNEDDLQNRVKVLREAGLSARDAASQVSTETGVPKNTLYRMAVKA